ncbi:citrate synthase [bacterium]|nr:citrate synthase [bacterium]MBP9807871.1 citrate synthase [bacterium]
MEKVNSGLDGVVVAETVVSEVDGKLGRLIIKGVDTETLGFTSTFEETCSLLWQGLIPESLTLPEMKQAFYQGRLEAFALAKENPHLFKRSEPMEVLRTTTSLLSGGTEKTIAAYIKIAAAVGYFAATWSRVQKGLEPLAPDANLSQAGDLLRMLTDKLPTANEIAALDTYLTTVSDHGMNASTFTARVVASTESDNVSCVVSAIGALKGPLHGGAPGPVLEMLNEIGSPDKAEAWLVGELNQGKRIMGMGHRIYQVRDPRAAIFEKAISLLEEQAGASSDRLLLARSVERTAERILAERHPEKPLKANVEFYTAVLLDTLKIPHQSFSSMFAAGRVGGWLAHIAEQRALGRLIRPASRYTGNSPN